MVSLSLSLSRCLWLWAEPQNTQRNGPVALESYDNEGCRNEVDEMLDHTYIATKVDRWVGWDLVIRSSSNTVPVP